MFKVYTKEEMDTLCRRVERRERWKRVWAILASAWKRLSKGLWWAVLIASIYFISNSMGV